MELDHMMYVGKHPNIIELIGVCSIKGMPSCHLDIFFSQWSIFKIMKEMKASLEY